MPIVTIMKIEPVLLTKGVESKRNVAVDPRQDSIGAAGIYFQSKSKTSTDEKVGAWRDADELYFKDAKNSAGVSLSDFQLPTRSAGTTFQLGDGGPILTATDSGILELRSNSGKGFAPIRTVVRLPSGTQEAGSAPLQFLEGLPNAAPAHGSIEFNNGLLTVVSGGGRQALNQGPTWSGVTTAKGRTELFLEGSHGGRLVLADNSLYAFDILAVGVNTEEGSICRNAMRGVIRRSVGEATTEILPDFEEHRKRHGGTTIDVQAAADTTNGALAIFVTPELAGRHNWIVRGRLLQLSTLST